MFLAVRYYTDKWQLQTAHSTQRPDPAPGTPRAARRSLQRLALACLTTMFANLPRRQRHLAVAIGGVLRADGGACTCRVDCLGSAGVDLGRRCPRAGLLRLVALPSGLDPAPPHIRPALAGAQSTGHASLALIPIYDTAWDFSAHASARFCIPCAGRPCAATRDSCLGFGLNGAVLGARACARWVAGGMALGHTAVPRRAVPRRLRRGALHATPFRDCQQQVAPYQR
eukprot:3015696-Rhodomonas_salina.3